jgi:hypothetical protein
MDWRDLIPKNETMITTPKVNAYCMLQTETYGTWLITRDPSPGAWLGWISQYDDVIATYEDMKTSERPNR